jgi:hypothetical protein
MGNTLGIDWEYHRKIMIYWDLMGYSGIYIGRIFFLRFFFVFFWNLCCFSVWGTFPCYLLHFGAKTSTLLNLGAKICHLHCSSIV